MVSSHQPQSQGISEGGRGDRKEPFGERGVYLLVNRGPDREAIRQTLSAIQALVVFLYPGILYAYMPPRPPRRYRLPPMHRVPPIRAIPARRSQGDPSVALTRTANNIRRRYRRIKVNLNTAEDRMNQFGERPQKKEE